MRATVPAIGAFWSWWREAAPRFEGALGGGRWRDPAAAGELAEEMTGRVHAIDPRLAWEIGTGQQAEYALCVSPEGDAALRNLTERWYRSGPAPNLAWEYHPARPPAPATLDATVIDLPEHAFRLADARVAVEVDEVRRVLDVAVWHPRFAAAPDEVRDLVAMLLLDRLLGEDGVERWVGAVTTSAEAPPGTVPAASLPALTSTFAESEQHLTWAVAQADDHARGLVTRFTREGVKRIDWPLYDLLGRVTMTVPDAVWSLPGAALLDAVQRMDDDLVDALDGRAVLVRRETWGLPDALHVTLTLYCDSHGPAPALVEAWGATHPGWRLAAFWKPDPAWTAGAD